MLDVGLYVQTEDLPYFGQPVLLGIVIGLLLCLHEFNPELGDLAVQDFFLLVEVYLLLPDGQLALLRVQLRVYALDELLLLSYLGLSIQQLPQQGALSLVLSLVLLQHLLAVLSLGQRLLQTGLLGQMVFLRHCYSAGVLSASLLPQCQLALGLLDLLADALVLLQLGVVVPALGAAAVGYAVLQLLDPLVQPLYLPSKHLARLLTGAGALQCGRVMGGLGVDPGQQLAGRADRQEGDGAAGQQARAGGQGLGLEVGQLAGGAQQGDAQEGGALDFLHGAGDR